MRFKYLLLALVSSIAFGSGIYNPGSGTGGTGGGVVVPSTFTWPGVTMSTLTVVSSATIQSPLVIGKSNPITLQQAAGPYSGWIGTGDGNMGLGGSGISVPGASLSNYGVGVDNFQSGDGKWRLGTTSGYNGKVKLSMGAAAFCFGGYQGFEAYDDGVTCRSDSWVLPGSDAAGCWKSDGAHNLSIGSCGGGGGGLTNAPTVNAASQFSAPYYSYQGSSNTLSAFPGLTLSTATVNGGVIASTMSVSSFTILGAGDSQGLGVKGSNAATLIWSTSTATNGSYQMAVWSGTDTLVAAPVPTGGGTPGGTSGQVQYNNASSFGGISGSFVGTSSTTIPNVAASTVTIGTANSTGTLMTYGYHMFVSTGMPLTVASSATFTAVVGISSDTAITGANGLTVTYGVTAGSVTAPGLPKGTYVTTASSTTTGALFANAPTLAQTVVANSTTYFDCYMLFSTTATTNGIGLAVTVPSGNIFYTALIPVAADGTAALYEGWGTTSGDLVIGTGVQTANTTYVARLFGSALNTGAGNIQMGFSAKNAAANVTLQPGSRCQFW